MRRRVKAIPNSVATKKNARDKTLRRDASMQVESHQRDARKVLGATHEKGNYVAKNVFSRQNSRDNQPPMSSNRVLRSLTIIAKNVLPRQNSPRQNPTARAGG
jgi:hypothetical protein